ncbi:MAG TPA: hypothetical protein VGH72_33725 [Pseudonocardia sp.]
MNAPDLLNTILACTVTVLVLTWLVVSIEQHVTPRMWYFQLRYGSTKPTISIAIDPEDNLPVFSFTGFSVRSARRVLTGVQAKRLADGWVIRLPQDTKRFLAWSAPTVAVV